MKTPERIYIPQHLTERMDVRLDESDIEYIRKDLSDAMILSVIDYIKNDAEIFIPIERFFDSNGNHITKKKYGKVLLEVLCKELKEKFIPTSEPITETI